MSTRDTLPIDSRLPWLDPSRFEPVEAMPAVGNMPLHAGDVRVELNMRSREFYVQAGHFSVVHVIARPRLPGGRPSLVVRNADQQVSREKVIVQALDWANQPSPADTRGKIIGRTATQELRFDQKVSGEHFSLLVSGNDETTHVFVHDEGSSNRTIVYVPLPGSEPQYRA